MTCVQADQQGHPLQRNRLYSEWQELPSSHLPIQSSAEHSLVGQKTVRPKHLFERRLFVFWGKTIDARPCQWLRGRDRDWHHECSPRLSSVTPWVVRSTSRRCPSQIMGKVPNLRWSRLLTGSEGKWHSRPRTSAEFS